MEEASSFQHVPIGLDFIMILTGRQKDVIVGPSDLSNNPKSRLVMRRKHRGEKLAKRQGVVTRVIGFTQNKPSRR